MEQSERSEQPERSALSIMKQGAETLASLGNAFPQGRDSEWPAADREADEMPGNAPSTQPSSDSTADTADDSHPNPASSFSLNQPDSWLEMELVIRGHARPNSHFVFHGQSIPTAEDGSFSLSRILPPETAALVAQLLAASRKD
jgi:hypothetical protein